MSRSGTKINTLPQLIGNCSTIMGNFPYSLSSYEKYFISSPVTRGEKADEPFRAGKSRVHLLAITFPVEGTAAIKPSEIARLQVFSRVG